MNYTICADIYKNETNNAITYFTSKYIPITISAITIQQIVMCVNIANSMFSSTINFLNQINAENITTTQNMIPENNTNSKITDQSWFIILIVFVCLLFCALLAGCIFVCKFLSNLRVR